VTASWLVRHRGALWAIGVEHREALMTKYMLFYSLTQRPMLKTVFREVIGEVQEVRILDGPLPMDRFAQTEIVDGYPEITINSLIGRMPRVKDPHGIGHVAAWHESIHIPVDVEWRYLPPNTYLISGLEGSTSSPLLCAATGVSPHRWSLHEQAIETAALAAAVADADLRRCHNYLNFLELASWGGDMGPLGWQLLASISAVIGVNRTALRRYFEQHGICRLLDDAGEHRLIGTQQPFGGFVCLEPESASIRSIA
jgi:hypothetical protein